MNHDFEVTPLARAINHLIVELTGEESRDVIRSMFRDVISGFKDEGIQYIFPDSSGVLWIIKVDHTKIVSIKRLRRPDREAIGLWKSENSICDFFMPDQTPFSVVINTSGDTPKIGTTSPKDYDTTNGADPLLEVLLETLPDGMVDFVRLKASEGMVVHVRENAAK